MQSRTHRLSVHQTCLSPRLADKHHDMELYGLINQSAFRTLIMSTFVIDDHRMVYTRSMQRKVWQNHPCPVYARTVHSSIER
jgi:hypothetical protein